VPRPTAHHDVPTRLPPVSLEGSKVAIGDTVTVKLDIEAYLEQ
jgi:hypothetical protein